MTSFSLLPSIVQCYAEIFDESSRINVLFESFSWAFRVCLFEKESSCMLDAASIPSNVIYARVPYSQASENTACNLQKIHSEWVFFLTASSSIDPSLVDLVEISLLSAEISHYNALNLPYKLNVLGLSSSFSPWSASKKMAIIRMKDGQFTSIPHREISVKNPKPLSLPFGYGYFHHVTHPTLDRLCERHLRYARAEISHGNRYPFSYLLKELIKGFFVVKFWRFGRRGLFLFLAYITYPLFLCLFSFEKSNPSIRK